MVRNLPKTAQSLYGRASNWWGVQEAPFHKGVDSFFGSKSRLGAGIKGLSSPLSLAYVGYSAISGGYEGGLSGALYEGGKAVFEDVAFTVAWNALGPAGAIGGALLAGSAYGAYKAVESGYDYYHGKKRKALEMGQGVADPFGTAATMRQRSLAAMNSSHMNLRSALGNEAIFLHR